MNKELSVIDEAELPNLEESVFQNPHNNSLNQTGKNLGDFLDDLEAQEPKVESTELIPVAMPNLKQAKSDGFSLIKENISDSKS